MLFIPHDLANNRLNSIFRAPGRHSMCTHWRQLLEVLQELNHFHTRSCAKQTFTCKYVCNFWHHNVYTPTHTHLKAFKKSSTHPTCDCISSPWFLEHGWWHPSWICSSCGLLWDFPGAYSSSTSHSYACQMSKDRTKFLLLCLSLLCSVNEINVKTGRWLLTWQTPPPPETNSIVCECPVGAAESNTEEPSLSHSPTVQDLFQLLYPSSDPNGEQETECLECWSCVKLMTSLSPSNVALRLPKKTFTAGRPTRHMTLH